ncbi:hypothetical protein PUN28_004287 [Cardiocondyla obscurior]|uniref:Uncharacterized protein n=1 Tax=Cardiocondyla obscurior TaxID=286306 RepID=A0AAW2GCS4_9HYME
MFPGCRKILDGRVYLHVGTSRGCGNHGQICMNVFFCGTEINSGGGCLCIPTNGAVGGKFSTEMTVSFADSSAVMVFGEGPVLSPVL